MRFECMSLDYTKEMLINFDDWTMIFNDWAHVAYIHMLYNVFPCF